MSRPSPAVTVNTLLDFQQASFVPTFFFCFRSTLLDLERGLFWTSRTCWTLANIILRCRCRCTLCKSHGGSRRCSPSCLFASVFADEVFLHLSFAIVPFCICFCICLCIALLHVFHLATAATIGTFFRVFSFHPFEKFPTSFFNSGQHSVICLASPLPLSHFPQPGHGL